MLTRTGIVVAVGSLLLGIAGRVLGLLELFVVAAAGIALVSAALVMVRRGDQALTVRRRIHPARVHAGVSSHVELSIANPGRKASPVLSLTDQVTGTTGASMMLASLLPGGSVAAAYRLPTERRGVLHIGPLQLVRADPFGLARSTRRVGLEAELTVLPRVVSIAPLPYSLGNDPLAGSDQPNHLGRGGADFYALRPYVVGDDLRRVHWPSTARRGDLLVRQDEQPWQGRVSLLLDTRAGGSGSAVFEEMVTSAASVLVASRLRGDLVRLRTTGGIDTGFVAGRTQIDAVMECLAVVQPERGDGLATALAAAGRDSGSLVVVLGDGVSRGELDAVAGVRSQAGGVTVVHHHSRVGPAEAAPGPGAGGAGGADTPSITPELARRARARVVRVGPGRSFAAGWNAAVASRSGPR